MRQAAPGIISPMMPGSGHSLLCLPFVTYLDYIIFFNQCDREQRFSDGATRMYVKLLDVANTVRVNGGQLLGDFQRSDGYMESVCGWSTNTLKKHRAELVSRGLLSGDFGQAGRNSSGKYHLIHPTENVSTSDTISADNLSNIDTIPLVNLSDVDTISPETPLNVSGNVSNVDTLYKEEDKENKGAAHAASPARASAKKSSAEKPSTSGPSEQEIAALALPFSGAEFADLWATFRHGAKQAKKERSAFELMLKKLGKYPEAFAVVMLESAIQGGWSGVENPGTPRAYEEWAAQQTRAPLPSTTGAHASPAPELNLEFIAEQEAEEARERAEHFERFATQTA